MDGKIDLDRHRKLLQGLASDDDLRARFERDPAGVLAEHGIHVDADQVPTNRSLPSKEEIGGTIDDRLAKFKQARARMWPAPLWNPQD